MPRSYSPSTERHAAGAVSDCFPFRPASRSEVKERKLGLRFIHTPDSPRGISGIELQRRLAASGSKWPVIFMTANDDEATRNEAMDAGCIAYLRKPFEGHECILVPIAAECVSQLDLSPNRLSLWAGMALSVIALVGSGCWIVGLIVLAAVAMVCTHGAPARLW